MDETQTHRAIRFRAWCTKSHQWINPEEHYLALDGRGVVYNYDDIGCGVLGADIGQSGVIVEQFTGLKDKNGVDVFEGDILESPHYSADDWERSEVQWYAEYARFVLYFYSPYGVEGWTGREQAIDQFVSGGCVVVGNIHENRQLLFSDKAHV